VVGRPAPNDAVKKPASPDIEVVQDVGWNVRGDAGIRVSHNSDALVTGFAVTK
jgi:hypothetical protein